MTISFARTIAFIGVGSRGGLRWYLRMINGCRPVDDIGVLPYGRGDRRQSPRVHGDLRAGMNPPDARRAAGGSRARRLHHPGPHPALGRRRRCEKRCHALQLASYRSTRLFPSRARGMSTLSGLHRERIPRASQRPRRLSRRRVSRPRRTHDRARDDGMPPPPDALCPFRAAHSHPRRIRGNLPSAEDTWRLVRAVASQQQGARSRRLRRRRRRPPRRRRVGKRGHDRGDASRWSSRGARDDASPRGSERSDRGLRGLVRRRRCDVGKGGNGGEKRGSERQGGMWIEGDEWREWKRGRY